SERPQPQALPALPHGPRRGTVEGEPPRESAGRHADGERDAGRAAAGGRRGRELRRQHGQARFEHGAVMKKILAVVVLAATVNAARPEGVSPVADAAMRKDADAVRTLVRQGGDVNAAQADGMTALHWIAMQGDADLARVLLYAGGNVRATTRLGGYTPLHLASQSGSAATNLPPLRARAALRRPPARRPPAPVPGPPRRHRDPGQGLPR